METTPTTSDYSQLNRSATAMDFTMTTEQFTTMSSTTDSLDDMSAILAYYFEIALILIGFVGTVANGATLFALIFAKQVTAVFIAFIRKFSNELSARTGLCLVICGPTKLVSQQKSCCRSTT
jgi:hypothetical protein